MKSSTRNLAIVAAIVVVLGGAVAALTLTGGQGAQTSSSESSSSSTINLVSKKTDDIVSMQVTNKKGSYTIVPKTSGVTTSTASTASGSSEAEYTVKELTGVPVDSSVVSNVVKMGYSLAASKNIGTVSDLSIYGLDNPQATVKINFKDNTTYNYKIGNVSPTDTTSYYMCAENSKNVYIVSIDSSMMENKYTFVQKTILSITPDTSTSSGSTSSGTASNDFTKIDLSGTNFPKSVSISKDATSTYVITAPSKFDVETTPLTTMTSALASLSASDVAEVNPDAATLKKYGLDKPSAIVSFTVNKKSYKLSAGAKKDSSRYVMLDGVNVIYLVTNDSVSSWADTSLYKLRSKFVCLPMITDVSGMTVTSGSDVNTFNITRTKDEKNSTEDSPAYTYALTGNSGKKLTFDPNFKGFYQTVIGICLVEESDKQPTGTPAITIEYKYYSGTKHTVQFYSAGDRRYTAVVDGVVSGLVKSSDVEAITANVKKMQNNEAFSSSAS